MIIQKSNSSSLTQLPPLSLYIHIPWCVKKCPYCDFNSHAITTGLPEQLYIQSLKADLEQALPLIWGRTIRTIFIGGGTPSLFSGDAIDQILTMVRNVTNLSPLAEITLEANPGTVDNEHIADYKKSGVNRISFGIQSFNDKHLKSLGRIHNSAESYSAINTAKKHFAHINLDIIYGLPEQTLEEVKSDIEIALGFSTSHLSCYNLTLEPNTQFFAKPPAGLPDNDLCYTMQDLIIKQLKNAGFHQYEVSAYAKDNNMCAHNINYWQFGDYLGIGAGAHSKLSFHNKIIRQVRQKHPKIYINAVIQNKHIIEDKIVKEEELPFEFMLNALRLTSGFSSSLFVERTGLGLNKILTQLDVAEKKGFLDFKDGRISPTQLGHDFLNDVLLLFLNDC